MPQSLCLYNFSVVLAFPVLSKTWISIRIAECCWIYRKVLGAARTCLEDKSVCQWLCQVNLSKAVFFLLRFCINPDLDVSHSRISKKEQFTIPNTVESKLCFQLRTAWYIYQKPQLFKLRALSRIRPMPDSVRLIFCAVCIASCLVLFFYLDWIVFHFSKCLAWSSFSFNS